MAEPKITGNIRVVDGSTNLRTLKEINTLLTTLNTNVTNLTTAVTNLQNMRNLSTRPKQIGTWIDGKPLYEVLMYKLDTNPTTRAYWLDFADWGITNCKMAFVKCGFTRYPDNKYWYTLEGAGCTVQLTPENALAVFINNNAQSRHQDMYAIINFTKTTD